jgi:hypothetical protein
MSAKKYSLSKKVSHSWDGDCLGFIPTMKQLFKLAYMHSKNLCTLISYDKNGDAITSSALSNRTPKMMMERV